MNRHAALIGLSQRVGSRGSLVEFGKLLNEHIRFEERLLFERAQEVLSEDELAEILAACPKMADRQG